MSVIIPAYQAAATIGEALDSVFAQTVLPTDVVVCDDGSTDNLGTALEPYLERIVLVEKPNGGEGSAKDAASRAATGEFVMVLDADDALLPRRVEALTALAVARSDLDILTTDAFLEHDRTILRRSYSPEWPFEIDDQRRGILERNFIFSAAAIRRDRLLAAGGFDPRIRYAADWELWIRLILSGSSAGLIDAPLYAYRVGPTALSADRVRLVQGFVRALEGARSFELSPNELEVLARSLAEKRRELRMLELRDALISRSGARRTAVAVLGTRGVPAQSRAKALATFLSPRLTARLRPPSTAWTGAGGTEIRALQRTKLVTYSDANDLGGAEVSLGNLLAELPSSYDVTVLGVCERVVDAVAKRRPGSRKRVVTVASRVRIGGFVDHVRTFRAERPDIVHVSMNTPWACRWGILAALLTPGARVVLVEQALFPTTSRVQRAFKRIAARRAAAHVAVGEQSARTIELMSGLRAGSVQTIYNGLPSEALERGLERTAERPVVGSVGRLDSGKGYDVLLAALVSLPPVDVVLVGGGQEQQDLERRAIHLPAGGRLEVTGWTDEPRALLPTFDIFVLPSRLESFPLSIVEAMLAELAIVATDVGSVREAILDGTTGLLIPPDDVEALRTALRRLLEDPELRSDLGHAAGAYARERFTAKTMAFAFDSLYQAILGQQRGRSRGQRRRSAVE